MKKDSSMRPAKVSEAAFLSELALRSKAHWGYPASFMMACREELSVTEDDISHALREYVVYEVDGSVRGYFAIEPVSKSEYELAALFVEPKHIGKGHGKALLEEAKKTAIDRGADSLLIQSDPYADEFYRTAGAIQTGKRESGSIPGRYLSEFRICLS